ncbi:ABC transporter permease [Desulfosarcina ovata]|uniref:ABC transporter permease n=1 Tax=Desulfosarcina ovata TaxID=83564 RepID=UPI0012D2E93C|nr:ABC transporter permease [Desulfosarcina ovata]
MHQNTLQNSHNSLIYKWDLLRELVRRDLKIQYEGTILGFAWTLLMPFLHLGIFYLLFKIILQVKVQRFTTYAFIGIVAYGWFQSALSQAVISASSNKELILRPRFPAPIMPVVSVTSSMLHFIFTFPLIFIIVILEDHSLSASILLLPIVIGIQFMLTLGLGYLSSILNVVFRDTRPILDVFLRLFYFLSPVFYDPGMIPGKYQWLYNLNPLVSILRSYRDIILHGRVSQWSSLAIVAVASICCAGAGYAFFKKQSYRFLEEL